MLLGGGILFILIFFAIIFSCYGLLKQIPTSLVPNEDMGNVIIHTILPEGASLSRTTAVQKDLIAKGMENPLISELTTISGYSFLSGNFKSNGGVAFYRLIPWNEREKKGQSDREVIATLSKELESYPNARFLLVQAPTIIGLDSSGINLYVQSKAGGSLEDLKKNTLIYFCKRHKKEKKLVIFLQA